MTTSKSRTKFLVAVNTIFWFKTFKKVGLFFGFENEKRKEFSSTKYFRVEFQPINEKPPKMKPFAFIKTKTLSFSSHFFEIQALQIHKLLVCIFSVWKVSNKFTQDFFFFEWKKKILPFLLFLFPLFLFFKLYYLVDFFVQSPNNIKLINCYKIVNYFVPNYLK